MKKILFAVLAFVSLLAIHFLMPHGNGAVACAMFVPMMPSIMGRRLLNRISILDDGTWGPGGEKLTYPVYDRLRLLNSLGVATRSLFKTAVGQQRENVQLTYADTNVEKSESIPSSQKWTLTRLNLYYQSTTTKTGAQFQTVLDYYRTTTVRCIIDSKTDMFRVPLWRFLGSTQIVGVPAVTQNNTVPMGSFMGSFVLDVPIILQSLTDWEVRIEPLVASAAGLDNDFIGFEFETTRDRKN